MKMKSSIYAIVSIFVLFSISIAQAVEDERELVKMPGMMQEHMLANMRDHLAALNEIVEKLATGEFDVASDIAESRLGMSSLERHGASHMAKVMPEAMQRVGTSMHKAASHFALKAQEGEVVSALDALSEVTVECVACHSTYRIR